VDIIEFVESPELIGDKNLSPAQRTALKSVYGLPLDTEEISLFKLTTGLSEYPYREWSEATFILGRRSGKSDKLASNIALYEAMREHGAGVGEVPTVMVVASEAERQAGIVFSYIEAKLDRSPVLRRLIKRRTADRIELTNGAAIQIFPPHLARVRGMSISCFVGDECSFWKVEGRSVDREVIEAVRPGLSFEHSKLIKISTPYMQRGEIWTDYREFYGKPNDQTLVFQGSTRLFYPGYSEKKLDEARHRDKESYLSEYEARFRIDLSSMYDSTMIEAAVNSDRPMEMEPREGLRYSAFVDCAGGGGKDSYAICLGHRSEGKVIIDVCRSRAPKFNPEEATRQFSELLRAYRIGSVTGDKFSGDWSLHSFGSCGIGFIRSEKTKSQLYLESEGLFNSGQIEIPNRKILIEQLRGLVRKTRSGGQDSVDSDAGQPEDEANVVCGLAAMLGKWMPRRKGSVSYSGKPAGPEKPKPPAPGPPPVRIAGPGRLGKVCISGSGAGPKPKSHLEMSPEEYEAWSRDAEKRRKERLNEDSDDD